MNSCSPSDYIVGIVFTVFFCSWAYLSIRSSLTKNGRTAKSWKAFAQMFGMDLKPGSITIDPIVSGKYKGLWVHLTKLTTSSEHVETDWTIMTVHLSIKTKFNLHLFPTPKNLWGKLTPSEHDILTGDPLFDAAYEVESNIPHGVPMVLTDEVRKWILGHKKGTKFWVRNENEIVCQSDGIITDPQHLLYMLETLVKIGEIIVRIESPQSATS